MNTQFDEQYKQFMASRIANFEQLNKSLEALDNLYSLYEQEQPEGSIAAPAIAGTDIQSAIPEPLDNVAKSNYLNVIRKLLSYCQDNFAKLSNPSISDISDRIIKTTKIDASNAESIDKLIETLLGSLENKNFPNTSY